MPIFRQEICYKQQKQEWQQLDEQLAESNQAGNLKITGFFSKPGSRWEGTRRGLRAPSSPSDAGVGCFNLGASKAKQRGGADPHQQKKAGWGCGGGRPLHRGQWDSQSLEKDGGRTTKHKQWFQEELAVAVWEAVLMAPTQTGLLRKKRQAMSEETNMAKLWDFHCSETK